MAAIDQIRERYQGEWLAIAVLNDSEGTPVEGELIYHSPDEKEVWRKIRGDERRIYVTYGGPLVEEGHAVAF